MTATTYRYEQLDAEDERWWCEVHACEGSTVFQTRAWVDFLSITQHAIPVLAALKNGNRTVGFFVGLIARKLGVRILGSPCPGWSTDYMGFALLPGASRKAALRGLFSFAFEQLKCVHVEVMDRYFVVEDLTEVSAEHSLYEGFAVDLIQEEASIFGNFTSACRRCIRKGEKADVVIEVAKVPGFAEHYYEQLNDVFAKQGLIPTYGIERVQQLISHLYPVGRVLLLRARDRSGRCIATGIFHFLSGVMYFWGGASWRQFQTLRPNQALHWYAMRYAKAAGIHAYDMGGGGDYKRQYGGYEISVPWIRKSKYAWLESARNLAQCAYKVRQHVQSRLQNISTVMSKPFQKSSAASTYQVEPVDVQIYQ